MEREGHPYPSFIKRVLMLTDIFAHRYKHVELWKAYDPPAQRLLVQLFRIFSEQVCPFQVGEAYPGRPIWTALQSRLSMEFGLLSLAPLTYNFMGEWLGKPHHYHGTWAINDVCTTWFTEKFDGKISADAYIKERLSFIELGFRMREQEIALLNANLSDAMKAADSAIFVRPARMKPAEKYSDALRRNNIAINQTIRSSIEELNVRLGQAEAKLNYHNGFLQMSPDALVETHIETPFWKLVSDPKWKNVDIDMKEAFDRRDSGDRDPAFYAVRALESAIKVISGARGWTHGRETGAHNFIDNLASKRADYFIADWEASALKYLFAKVRNPLGHGPGAEEMPALTREQTDWAIETSVSWVKSIIRRS